MAFVAPGTVGSGPWGNLTYFIACNTSVVCDELLGTDFKGTTTCAPNALISPSDREYSYGGCVCNTANGYDGESCTALSPASQPAQIALGLSLAYGFLVILLYAPQFVYLVQHKKLSKINSAVTTFALTWCALLVACVAQVAQVLRATKPDSNAVVAMVVAHRAAIVVLAAAVLNMSTTFVEIGFSKRAVTNVKKLRYPLMVAIFVLILVIVLCVILTPPIVMTIVGVVVIAIVAVMALVGPAYLYVKAVRNLEELNGMVGSKENVLNEPTPKIPLARLLFVMLQAIFWDTREMTRVLGLGSKDSCSRDEDTLHSKPSDKPAPYERDADSKGSKASAGSRISKDSKDSKNDLDVESESKRHSRQLYAVGSKSSAKPPKRRSKPMLRFLAKTTRMGFFLSLFLILFIAFTAAEVLHESYYQASATLNYETMFLALAWISFFNCIHVILWYLGDAKNAPGPLVLWNRVCCCMPFNGPKEVPEEQSKTYPRINSKDGSKLSKDSHRAQADTGGDGSKGSKGSKEAQLIANMQ